MNLLIAGSVNEVSAGFIEGIEELKSGFLVGAAQAIRLPLVADAHGAEHEWRHMHSCRGRELTMTAEPCSRT